MHTRLKQQVIALNYNLKKILVAYKEHRFNNVEVIEQLFDKVDRFKQLVFDLDYNKINNEEINLMPLCNICHTQTNYKREDWTDYFNKKTSNLP